MSNERVVNAALAGGINQEVDQFLVKPPEMLTLQNATVVKLGRIEKRNGFDLVVSTPGTPATAFDGDAVPSPVVEAMSPYYGADGGRMLLAAGDTLYEHVGSDSTHGWRTVNKLPSYVGSLAGVTSSGGSIIEVETLEDSTGTYRLTVWVSGQRTGQERTSDLVYTSQTVGGGNAIYYAVQLIETGSFVKPPTLLLMSESVNGPIINMRLTKMWTSSTAWKACVAWQRVTAQTVHYSLVDFASGASTAHQYVDFAEQVCHRAFDAVGVGGGVGGLTNRVLFLTCRQDSASNSSTSKVKALLLQINPTTGAIVSTVTSADVIQHTAPVSGAWFNPWAFRGVVLDQTAGGVGSSTVSFSARAISSYFSAPATNSFQLDGQMVVGQVTIGSGGSSVASIGGQAYLPFIGFQTSDDHGSVFASAVGASYQTGAVSVTNGGFVGANISYLTTVTSSTFNTALVLTGKVGITQNVQVYAVRFGASAYAVTGPYTATDQPSITSAGSYPTPTHQYLNGAPVQPTITDPQTNWMVWNATTGGTYATGVYPGCYVFGPTAAATAIVAGYRYKIASAGSTDFTLIGAASNAVNTVFVATGPGTGSGTAHVQLAQATVYINASGDIAEMAIEDGLTVYAYPSTNSSAAISHVDGPTVATGSPAPTGGLAYTIKASTPQVCDFVDIPGTAVNTSNVSYYAGSGYENCVHRWSVIWTGTYVAMALASISANVLTTPNGEEPFGAADPHNANNLFEVYKWTPAVSGSTALVTPGASASSLIGALGGPWRLVSGLQFIGDASDHVIGCAVSPSADDSQRSTYLIRIGADTQTVSVTYPVYESQDGASSYTYANNPGMFVESSNMMRVTSLPINTPSLHTTSRGLVSAGLRDGSSKGTQQIFALDYESDAANWRKMQVLNDYTFINGGVPSVYDGVGVNEITSFVWPQRDFTSINWDRYPSTYQVTTKNSIYNYAASGTSSLAPYGTMPCAFFDYYANTGEPSPSSYPSKGRFLLVNITRPYFKYEAGFDNPNGYEPIVAGLASIGNGNGWRNIFTNWGGDPSKNYESVYSDPRLTQFSNVSKAKYTYGVNQAGETKQHYYGRYHNNPSGFGTHGGSELYSLWVGGGPSAEEQAAAFSLWVWAPRSASGFDGSFITNTWFSEKSVYSEADSGGDFLLRWTYEYIDGTGRVVRSAPSDPTQYTVCAQILGAQTNVSTDTPAYMGGYVSVFKYGFFAPRLELTNRLDTATADPRRVTLQPYTTAEPYSTVLYRVPFSNYVNPSSDFVIDRNVTRGVVPYTSSPVSGPDAEGYPLGFVTTNLMCFDGPLKDYNGVMAEPYLYTTGNVLDNVAPPSCKAMCVHQNRLFLGGADDESVVWFSKEITPTEAPGFNDELTLNISDGGPVTGLASLGDNLVVFKKNDVFIVSGTFPDATGVSTSLGTPYALPSGIGCVDHRSVIETPIGVFFRSTRSIELLKPNFEIFQIGSKVQEYLNSDEQILSVAHNAKAQEVYFTIGQGQILVYSYHLNGWYTWTAPDVSSLSSARAAVLGDTLWYSVPSDDAWNASHTAQAFTYKQNSLYVDQLRGTGSYTPAFYALNWSMGPFTMNEQQGYQRVKRVRIFSSVNGSSTIGLPGAQMLIGTDGGINGINDLVQTVTFTESQVKSIQTSQGFIQLETHCANQKGQLQLVGFTETAPAVVDDQCRNLFMSNIAVVVGLKTGLNKRITEQAKH
jgi:hypothetical protein